MNTVLIYNLANSLGFSTVGIGTFTVGFYRLGNCWELSYFTTEPHSFTTVDFRIFFPVYFTHILQVLAIKRRKSLQTTQVLQECHYFCKIFYKVCKNVQGRYQQDLVSTFVVHGRCFFIKGLLLHE